MESEGQPVRNLQAPDSDVEPSQPSGARAAPVNSISAPPQLTSRIRPTAHDRSHQNSQPSPLPDRPSAHTDDRIGTLSTSMESEFESPATNRSVTSFINLGTPRSTGTKKSLSSASVALAKAKAKSAQKMNDSMVYLDGPQVYTCAQCRTHLTSHDDIISKSFHGRRGRAYLFDQCVNVFIGPAEDRLLITGLHSVCDIFCKRCRNMVGWTYAKAYENSQKYKEGKFIIEKINLHLEESSYYDIHHPAGERGDRWKKRSMSWGNDSSRCEDIVYEYPHQLMPEGLGASSTPSTSRTRHHESPRADSSSRSLGSSPMQRRLESGSRMSTASDMPPAPPEL